MKFLEKDLEEIIFTTPTMKLLNKGFYTVPSKMKRQVSIGNYGRADIIGLDRQVFYCHDKKDYVWFPVISIIELKQDKISVSAFLQALNYVKGVKHYLRKHKPNLYKRAKFKLELIGKTIDNSGSFVYLPELLSSDEVTVAFYTYDYTVDGITFQTHSSYQLTKPGF